MTVTEFKEIVSFFVKSVRSAPKDRDVWYNDVAVEFVMDTYDSTTLPVVSPMDVDELDRLPKEPEVIQIRFQPTRRLSASKLKTYNPDWGGNQVKKVFEQALWLIKRLDEPESAEIWFTYDRVNWKVISHAFDSDELVVTFRMSKELGN